MSIHTRFFRHEESIERDRIILTNETGIINEFICPICYCLLWKPQSCATCQHLFCGQCIQIWSSTYSNTCPLCRVPYEEKPTAPIIQSLLTYFSIRCRNTSFGCSAILPYHLLEQHERTDCQFLTKKCRVCKQIVLDKEQHQHQMTCEPVLILCQICGCYIEMELLESHQNECLQSDVDELDDDLFTPWNFFNDPMFATTTTEIDWIGRDMFDDSRDKNCFFRLWAMFRLITRNLSLTHLILFNLFSCGCGNFVHGFVFSFVYLQTWLRTSFYQACIFLILSTIVFNHSLSILFQSIDDTSITLLMISTVISWSSISSRTHLNQFQMTYNEKDLLLVSSLIFMLARFTLLLFRIYLSHIPIHLASICLTISIICYSKYQSTSTTNCHSFSNLFVF